MSGSHPYACNVIVDDLIAQGLYILAGAPKVGKSWLSLDICLSIAKGEKVLDHETKCGTTLYLCLEDSFERTQKRLYELTDEPSESRFESMSLEYEKEQEEIRKALPELKIRIEKLNEKSNSADKFINVIRKYTIIDKLDAAILNELIDKIVVHHKEKSEDGSTYQQIEIFYRFVGKLNENI